MMSFSASIMPGDEDSMHIQTRAAASPLFGCRQLTLPAFAIQRIAVEMPIPNRTAAARANIPSADSKMEFPIQFRVQWTCSSRRCLVALQHCSSRYTLSSHHSW